MVRISKAPAEEPDLVGPAALIGTFSVVRRRAAVVGLFVVAALVILACAEPFAEALVDTGRTFGISEFLLVQWLAPLASEAPELLVAGLYAWRLNTNAGLGTLVSSKVNQWTLLIGTLPIAFATASGSLHGLPIIARQREEILLTAAQSLFAVATLCSLSLSVREAGLLFSLFRQQSSPRSSHDVSSTVAGGSPNRTGGWEKRPRVQPHRWRWRSKPGRAVARTTARPGATSTGSSCWPSRGSISCWRPGSWPRTAGPCRPW